MTYYDLFEKASLKYAQHEISLDEYEEMIEPLKREIEQQLCEDCISREAAIKQCGFGMTSLLIADNLRRLPPVTPRTNLAESSQDCVRRESVIEWLKDKDIIKTKNQEENARRELGELPFVTPKEESEGEE